MMIKTDVLLERAWQAMENAYAPYSGYHVGAALQTEDGDVFMGCNVENASYGGTICAERTAITKAVSEGRLKPGGLAAILVAVRAEKPAAPCGMCRQVIEEFAKSETMVLLSNEPGKVLKTHRHADLLPEAFGRGHLDAD